jgi:hypothetical protein
MIAVHDPDFEFANFAIAELVEIAARLDEAHGLAGGPARSADWTGVKKGKVFEERHVKVSKGAQSLQGEAWGIALGTYAAEHPRRSDNQAERSACPSAEVSPILRDLRPLAAVLCNVSVE